MMRRSFLLILAMIFSLSYSSMAQTRAGKAAANGWTVLGSKHVKRNADRDVLPVGANDGGFTKLKIKITGGTVYMARMVVTYGNGSKDEIPLRYVFKPGSESRVIDLRGGKRVIKKITFLYDRKNTARSAKVWVGGRR